MATDFLNVLKSYDEDFQIYLILIFILLITIIYVFYMIYLSTLKNRECNHMNSLYPSVNGYIRPISSNDPDCSGNLQDYYIKTAYNCCNGGSYKNDFVDICNLKAAIKQGIRCLDFEIYSIEDKPVVSSSTTDDYYIKETFNYVDFANVMDTLRNYAFVGGMCPNPTDPLLIHLRFKSNNQKMYSNLANIFKSNTDIMLGKNYSYEAQGKNLSNLKLLSMINKIILIVDRSNTSFLDNTELLEFINLTSSSVFMRKYNYYNVKNNPDMNELIEFNRRGMTIVLPDKGNNPSNPSGIVSRANGCQMVAMRYQYVDNNLMENNLFFDRTSYAFSLKPEALRYKPVTIPIPTPQNPEYSYATRNVATDYYDFKY
jgi:hypothetical protein